MNAAVMPARRRHFRAGNFFELRERQINLRFVNTPAAANARRNEVRLVCLISLLAALHVYIFTAAFPFFNSVDEQLHFDLAVRYSEAHVPRRLEPLSPEAIRYIVLFSSHAYLSDAASLPPPLWIQPAESVRPQIAANVEQWQNISSTESTQPPLYYAVAGVWWNTGKLLGLAGGHLLYWLRFLNIPLVAATVWLGWLAARKVFPESFFARMTVPAVIAFMPQTAFYAINNDILAPVVFGAAFLLLLELGEAEIPSGRLAASLGLALAATFLTKISTLPMLAVSVLFLAAKNLEILRQGKMRPAIFPMLALVFCTLLPVLAWMLWCKANYGDLTGSAVKVQKLGWTVRPPAQWTQHPIFSAHGLWVFVGDNLATFWQGEFWWQRQPLALPGLDLFYKLLTPVLLALAVGRILKSRLGETRSALIFSLACWAASLGFFALLSVKYDFQDCFYPSRTHPFFTSGRLFLGLLIPILILLAGGLDFGLQKISEKAKFLILFAWLAIMFAGETALDWRVFACEYNWYHL